MSIPLAIVGHGKMGRLVEQLAPHHGFSVVARFTSSNAASLSRETLAGATTAIEFSTPAAALENLCRLAALGVRTVSGTTGWYDHLPQIRNSVETAGSALLYGPNFSVGVNLFFQIVARAATLLCRIELGGSAQTGATSPYRVGGDSQRAAMAHPIDRHFVQRANTVVLLTILWGALAACALGAGAIRLQWSRQVAAPAAGRLA